MQKWEYRTVKMNAKGFLGGVLDTNEFDRLLNQLGQQGWNLVSTFDTNMVEGTSREFVAVFKRELA